MANDYLIFTENSGLQFDNFKPLNTFKVAFFQFIFTCSLEVLVVVLLLIRKHALNSCGQIVILLFAQTALWLVTFIIDHYYHACHYNLRLCGHFQQYKKFNKISTCLLYLVSFFLVNSFNRLRPLSDIERHECWFSSEHQTSTEVGYRLESEAITSFLEKQADLIEYYKVANNDLSKRLENVQSTLLQGHSGVENCGQPRGGSSIQPYAIQT
ncbi:uncharacterized protein isoform X2 [Rhodnius prolixus]|uniref:uncharacterized protein isoform X2 n=1 Tax=Rhodnius prolixus TaxID=13249 RepID=UPI003D18E0B0